MLRFPLADTCGAIVAFMAQGQQVRQDPAEIRRIELAALDQLPDETGVNPVVSPASGRLWGG